VPSRFWRRSPGTPGKESQTTEQESKAVSNHGKDQHHGKHGGHPEHPEHKIDNLPWHRGWMHWAALIAVVLMLVAMFMYAGTDNERLAPGQPERQEEPAAP
jgi:hypothetical protein